MGTKKNIFTMLTWNRTIATVIVLFLAVITTLITGQERPGSPAFYLGTDKTFGTDERPYVNLEGSGEKEYSFRIYRVKNPDDFFIKSVKGRLVKENNDTGYGNAVSLFSEAFALFKKDFREIARNEFNSSTRSQMKKATGVDLDSPVPDKDRALPSILANHELISRFSIPASKAGWSYRRVPVPVKDNGVYLVEAVGGKNLGYTVIVKSGINFVVKQSDADTLIFVARRDTGSAVDGADVKIYQSEGASVLAGGAAKNGIFAFKGKTPAKSLIIVKKNGEYAVSDPDFYAKSFYGEGGIRAYIYTDRPVYRPGDQVFFKGIVRNFSNDDYSVSSGNATVDVYTDEKNIVTGNIPLAVSTDTGTFEGSFNLPTDAGVYLGNYNIILKYNNKEYSTEFAVDAYKKPPFLVKVSTSKRVYIGKEKINISVSARYYAGGSVADEKLRYRVFRKKKFDYSPVGALPFFAEAAEYLGISMNTNNELVADGSAKLSSTGSYDFSVTPDKVEDDYTYSVLVDVTTADSTISGSASASVNRSAFFIRAIKEMAVFSPGDTVKIEALLVPFDSMLSAADKKSLLEKRTVKAILYTRTFVGISQEGKRDEVDSTDALTGPDGKASLSFKLPKKGHYIIVLRSEDPNGAKTVTETPIWASGKSDSIEVPFKNLTLKSSKDIYTVGDEAEVLIMSPSADGTLFVTLEGNRILGNEIVKLVGNTMRYRVKITQAMAPNFTIAVTQFAANEIYKNQIKIIAPPLDRFLTVKMQSMKSEYRPGDTAEIALETLSTKGAGVSAEVSVAVVDEAIFQIREDSTPNIGTFFYHPRTNNVSTVFSAAYRFFGYSEEKRLQLALDAKKNPALAALKEEDERSRERFKDTTYWSARITTDAHGKATVKVPLADNLTTWRVTAFAVTRDTKVGQGRTTFLSRKRLMVNAGLPSVMIRGDKQTVIASISNMTGAKAECTVDAVVTGGEIVGAKSQKISVDPGKSAPVYFEVKPSLDESVAFCSVEMKVSSPNGTDGVKHRVPLKYFGRKTVLPLAVAFTPKDETKQVPFTLPAKFAEPKCEVRLYPGSGEALRESLQYLAGYPYGCIEQTMSRFMPLLAAKQAGYVNSKLANELPAMVAEGIRLIKSHQMTDGGFGWYGEKGSDPMMSAYVYRGLVISKKLFGKTDDDLVSRTRYYLYAALDRNTKNTFEKAYIIFSLSEGGKVQKSMLDSLIQSVVKEGTYAKTLAALACINAADARGTMLYELALKEYQFSAKKSVERKEDWANDTVEIASALLYASVKLGHDSAAEDIARDLVAMRSGLAWKNSRDTAWAVIALSEKLKKYRETAEPSNISVAINGVPSQSVRVTAAEVDRGSTIINVPASNLRSGANAVSISKSGSSAVYATVLVTYTDRSDSFAPISNGFDLSRNYYLVATSKDNDEIKLSLKEAKSFNAGDLVMVEVKLKKTGDMTDYLMLEDPLPAGFSVVKNDGDYFSDRVKKEYGTKQAYDDRTVFFIRGPVNASTVRYFIRADIPGSYRTLPSSVSRMYYPEWNGSSSDNTLSVGK